MTTAVGAPGPTRTQPPPVPLQRAARAAGAMYLATFATSVPTLALYGPLADPRAFVTAPAGAARSVAGGATLEVLLALSCIGTAVALHPVLVRRTPTSALVFLCARVVEGCLVLVGVVGVVALLSLRTHAAAATATGRTASSAAALLAPAARALVGVHEGTFLVGQGLMPVVSALALGSALYRSRLVPRVIPAVGLVGAPLLLASDAAVLWGAIAQTAPLAGLAALPVAAWEFALGVWLVVRGVSPAGEASPPAHAGLRAGRSV